MVESSCKAKYETLKALEVNGQIGSRQKKGTAGLVREAARQTVIEAGHIMVGD